MSILEVCQLLLFTLGILCFGSLSAAWWREWHQKSGSVPLGHGLISLVSLLWFVVNLAGVLFPYLYPDQALQARFLMWGMAYAFPPLLLLVSYEEARKRVVLSRWWLVAIPAAALAAFIGALPPLLVVIGFRRGAWLNPALYVLMGLFLMAAFYSVAIGLVSRHGSESFGERRARRWQFALWGLVVAALALNLLPELSAWGIVSLICPAFPLLFLFASTYNLERFLFFDLFVKRGVFSCLVLMLIALHFAGISTFVEDLQPAGIRPWVYALSFLPLAFSLPWLYRLLEDWVDRVWLGRLFTPTRAVGHFLSGIQAAASQSELVARGESLLSEVFQAPAQICLEGTGSLANPGISIPFRIGVEEEGRVSLGGRATHQPFYDTDRQLLCSLMEVFASVLENVRLEEARRLQELREKQLQLSVSQSELKALRAQINPHFLFNALNAIAGLIDEAPEKAEKTVEQLAEVFRYTLRGSQKEWATLEEELEFVQAYLEVEKARFDERLQVRFEIDPDLPRLRIPTMLVQTLVENAVKHGVGRVQGTGRLVVRALAQAGMIRIEVRDNGPGPSASPRYRMKQENGFGLANVRDRLEGYFGSLARLQLKRDEDLQETVASIEVPRPLPAVRNTLGNESWSES